MAPTHLHVYQCSFCRTIATMPVRARSPLACNRCFRIMAYKWSQPITTQAERDIAANGLMFNPFMERPPARCGVCRTPMPNGAHATVQGAGTFCSEECTHTGVTRHQAYLKRLADEQAEQDRRTRPWLT